MNEEIIKVVPAPEELSSVCNNAQCPVLNCGLTFPSSSVLNMHFVKHHERQNLCKKNGHLQYQYHCPIDTCIYSKDFTNCRHFKLMKYLKQHFLKVHAAKQFLCGICEKGFCTLSFKTKHEHSCGKIYTCVCGYYYSTQEAMQVHLKRKGKEHYALDSNNITKQAKTPLGEAEDKVVTAQPLSASCHNEHSPAKRGDRLIYPKLGPDNLPFSVQYIAAIALSELSAPYNLPVPKVTDKGIQTDVCDSGHHKSSKRNMHYVKLCSDRKRKNSQQTQTGVVTGKCKKLKISAETQTSSEYLKHKRHGNKTPPRKRKKSMETQTKDVLTPSSRPSKGATLTSIAMKKHVFAVKQNQFLDSESLDEEMFNVAPGRDKNQCSSLQEDKRTQNNRTKQWIWDSQAFSKTEMVSTEKNKKSYLTTIKKELFSINQELNISDKDKEGDAQVFDINKLCNIETQTELDPMLLNCNEDTTFTLCSTIETQTTDDFESMLYSNMCTQTCEDADQLFNFIDIETQTAWPDLNL